MMRLTPEQKSGRNRGGEGRKGRTVNKSKWKGKSYSFKAKRGRICVLLSKFSGCFSFYLLASVGEIKKVRSVVHIT